MTPNERIIDLAQQIYLVRHNIQNDVTGTELAEFLANTVMQVNQYLAELDKEAYWNWVRTNDYVVEASATTGDTSYTLPSTVRTVVRNPDRPLYLVKDGQIVSTWDIVSPNMVTNAATSDNPNRVTLIGKTLKLSRAITAQEDGATVYCDIVEYLPHLVDDDTAEGVEVLDLVDPVELIILGVAKNQVLPDIVQGGLTPSYTVKYADLLNGTKAENDGSAIAENADGENYAYINGVW